MVAASAFVSDTFSLPAGTGARLKTWPARQPPSAQRRNDPSAEVESMSFYRSSWCDVDLAQFRRNLGILSGIAKTKVLLVVKANAYGHGIVPIAQAASSTGVDMLGVATIEEAAQLLAADVSLPILVMTALDSSEADFCVAHGIHFLAWRADQFREAHKAAEFYQRKPLIHLEVDTGISRSGIAVSEFKALLDSLSPEEKRGIVGLASHFYGADLESTAGSEDQLRDYLTCVEEAEKQGLRPLLHTANSPGTIRIPASRLGMTRLGIAAYGLEPSAYTPLPPGVAPILSWKANVTDVRTIPAGRGVGYGWKYIARTDSNLATLGVGYADGFRRTPEGINTVYIKGVEASVVGSVFMDQCVFLLPDGVNCSPGDTAVLLGGGGALSLSADELSVRWKTNNYDVIAGIRSRVPRRYSDADASPAAS